MIGAKLGPYEITSKLGEGGMGEVYRATDTKLKREVAIKVLPQAFTEDSERLARFEREAQLLAQLQHPNIASIYGLEESGSTRALVMELVEGPTLADRLSQGAIPLEESLAIAREIALALEAAHERGIVHRDLKPQNVKASDEGTVKVLDFGLAKAMDPTGAISGGPVTASPTLLNSPTLTAAGTELGVILGTAAYMSPEQAKGRPVDRRADIWAFGVVLFEMLTGRRLFEAESVPETLAAIFSREVSLEELPSSVPGEVRRLVGRCLERDPRRRLRDIGEARIALEGPFATPVQDASKVAGSGSKRGGRLGWAVAALLALAVAGLSWHLAQPLPRAPLLRFTLSAVSGASIVSGAGNSAISPDGRRIVFVGGDSEGRQGLWIQELDEVRARHLPDTEGATYPFWAPDSRKVAFFARGKLRRVSIDGGRVEAICDAIEGRGGSWGSEGTIVFAPGVTGTLSAVSESGGPTREVTALEDPEKEISHRFPSFLPDGRRFLYLADPGTGGEEGKVYLASVEGGARRLLLTSRRAPIYAEPGYLVYAIGDRLVARRFDPESGELRGEPRRLEEGTPGYVNTQDRAASVSVTGALLVPASETTGTRIEWLDRRGRLVGQLPLPRESFASPRLSPDGRRLAIYSDGPGEGESDLWVVDLTTEQASRLTFEPGVDRYPVWSPEGDRLAFQTDRSGVFDLWVRPAGGGGGESPLHESPTSWKIARTWVGEYLAFETVERETGFDIWLLRPDREGDPPIQLVTSPATEMNPAISPDGQWLAYTSNESGRDEVYVVSLPDARTKYQVTTEGGTHPVWSRGGRELFYMTPSFSIASVRVEPGEQLAFAAPSVLFPQPSPNWGTGSDQALFDVTSDGERIVMLAPENQGSQTLVVVTDWLAELEDAEGGR